MTAKEVWDSLAKIDGNPSIAIKIYLQIKLHYSRLQLGESVRKHIENIEKTRSQLENFGADVSDDLYYFAFLKSLPRTYESLVIALQNISVQIAIEKLHAQILQKEER